MSGRSTRAVRIPSRRTLRRTTFQNQESQSARQVIRGAAGAVRQGSPRVGKSIRGRPEPRNENGPDDGRSGFASGIPLEARATDRAGFLHRADKGIRLKVPTQYRYEDNFPHPACQAISVNLQQHATPAPSAWANRHLRRGPGPGKRPGCDFSRQIPQQRVCRPAPRSPRIAGQLPRSPVKFRQHRGRETGVSCLPWGGPGRFRPARLDRKLPAAPGRSTQSTQHTCYDEGPLRIVPTLWDGPAGALSLGNHAEVFADGGKGGAADRRT